MLKGPFINDVIKIWALPDAPPCKDRKLVFCEKFQNLFVLGKKYKINVQKKNLFYGLFSYVFSKCFYNHLKMRIGHIERSFVYE